MKVILSSILLLCLSATQARLLQNIDDAEKPWFCHDLDCPNFKILNTTSKYEVREYEAGTWVETKVESLLYSLAVTEGFKRLFDYISGKNADNQKIAMTVPVAINVVPGDGPFCKSIYTVAFFVPYKYQEDPPKPTDPRVSIAKTPKGSVAVLQYSGFVVDDWSISSKANSLKTALDANDVSYIDSSFFTIGYDPPTRLQHRHNEIWIALKSADEVIRA